MDRNGKCLGAQREILIHSKLDHAGLDKFGARNKLPNFFGTKLETEMSFASFEQNFARVETGHGDAKQ